MKYIVLRGGFIMAIDRKELKKEQLMKAVQCKTADELMALAKAEGIELTKAEAEAYMTELSDVELDNNTLKKVAGGDCYHHCPPDCHDCPMDYS
jgi:hypothetical protein